MAKHKQAGAPADGTPPEPSPEAGAGAVRRDQQLFVHQRLETSRDQCAHVPQDDVRPALSSPKPSASGAHPTTPCLFFFGKALTVPEVAEKLGISVSQVHNHIADGALQAVNLGRGATRRDLRVLDDALEAFVEARKVIAAHAAPVARPTGTARNSSYIERRAARQARKGA